MDIELSDKFVVLLMATSVVFLLGVMFDIMTITNLPTILFYTTGLVVAGKWIYDTVRIKMLTKELKKL